MIPSARRSRLQTTVRRSPRSHKPHFAKWSGRHCCRRCCPSASRAISFCAKKSDARPRNGVWPSVEIRDIGVPPALQDAMSRQAQAERERLARVLLGQAEQEIAQKFVEAADIYARSPAALQLRAMNIIYETTKERGATILIPTRMVDSMNPAAALGVVAGATQGRA